MGASRAWAPHRRWTDVEESVLREQYATARLDELEALLPGRSRRMIQCKANGMGLVRQRDPKRTPDQVRSAKRDQMAKKRAEAPDVVRAKQRQWVEQNRDRLNAKRREWHGARFFYARAKRVPGTTALQLWSLWKKQRGLCALTGERLDRTAELDHKLPKARGGNHSINNLQWVTAKVNRAKRDLTDAEFLVLCESVVRWIGERIEAVEAILDAQPNQQERRAA